MRLADDLDRLARGIAALRMVAVAPLMDPIPIASYAELMAAIRARRDELNLSHEVIDALTLLPDGYTSKMLSARPMKGMERLGPSTRLIFTVKDTSAYNEGERVVVAKLIIPTENLRAIASALLASETGQGIAEAAPAGEMRH